MRLSLREYQEVAVVKLLKVLQQARQGASAIGLPQGIQFSAPTGSGKTVMLAATIEALLTGNEYSAAAGIVPTPDLTFLWLSDLPELNRQSMFRIHDFANGLAADQLVEIEQDFDRAELDAGRVYFLNYQKLRAGSLLTRIGDLRTRTIWETIAATQAARPGKLIAIIDEAHRGLANTRTAQTIASKFVLGAQGSPPDPLIRSADGQERPWPALDIVLGMSATPERFQSYLTNQGGRSIMPVVVHPVDVRGSGLIKDQLILNGCREGEAPWSLLTRSIERTRAFEQEWRAYTEANALDSVTPALLIQVEDGTGREVSDTPLHQVLETLRENWPALTEAQVAHCFYGSSDIEFGGWRIAYRDPSLISDDETIRVILFKTALNTGWDCPRAEVLMSFRSLRDRTAIAQLVGRMVRTPLARAVPGDAVLNSTHLFLPFFERGQLENVRDELLSDLGESGTQIAAATNIQELVLRTGGEALFDALKIAPTEVVPSARPMPEIRRLLRSARLLQQYGLDETAVRRAVNALTDILRTGFAERRADPAFKARVARRGEYLMSSVTVQDGVIVSEDSHGDALAAADVETSYSAAAAIVAEEIASAWIRERFDPENPLRAKLEFLELVSIPAVLAGLQQQASTLLTEIERAHRDAIVALPPAHADLFAILQRAGRVAQLALMMPEQRVLFPLYDDARQQSGHLFVAPGTNDQCFLKLNGWEIEALDEERRRADYLGFLRNIDRKRWALSYAYNYDGVRAGYPDLLIFRVCAHGVIIDILEPHLDAGDSVAKAKGLARFAATNTGRFGRVEMLRKLPGSTSLRRLNLADPETASAVSRVATTEELNTLFRDLGYLSSI
ncbi:MAG TPA: DEAD/DEAH box helicase family protein [Acidobacteriaceae bacterium]|nr:DEAD/DEAH box helicase family protein [Acidobacteriaceae bacterium]